MLWNDNKGEKVSNYRRWQKNWHTPIKGEWHNLSNLKLGLKLIRYEFISMSLRKKWGQPGLTQKNKSWVSTAKLFLEQAISFCFITNTHLKNGQIEDICQSWLTQQLFVLLVHPCVVPLCLEHWTGCMFENVWIFCMFCNWFLIAVWACNSQISTTAKTLIFS